MGQNLFVAGFETLTDGLALVLQGIFIVGAPIVIGIALFEMLRGAPEALRNTWRNRWKIMRNTAIAVAVVGGMWTLSAAMVKTGIEF